MPDTEEKRREFPPCDLHDVRIKELEKDQEGMKKTMFGEDGRGGINGAVFQIEKNTETYGSKLANFKNWFIGVNVLLFIAILINLLTKGG
jgi:hypothetical protein